MFRKLLQQLWIKESIESLATHDWLPIIQHRWRNVTLIQAIVAPASGEFESHVHEIGS
jgi:hypothetical protein